MTDEYRIKALALTDLHRLRRKKKNELYYKLAHKEVRRRSKVIEKIANATGEPRWKIYDTLEAITYGR